MLPLLLLSSSFCLAAPPVTWRTDYAGAQALSKQLSVPLLVVVGGPECSLCVKLEKATWSNEGVKQVIRDNYVALKIDGEQEKALAKSLWVRRYPTVILAAPDGTVLSFEEGFVEPAAMSRRLTRAVGGAIQKAKTTTKLVPCRTVVDQVHRTFSDGSHEHVCPNCGTSWVHGGRSGHPVSHVCPGFRAVADAAALSLKRKDRVP